MDFNKKINRKNTGSIKWDMMTGFNKPEDVLPLWVADMDFQAPVGVIKALENRMHHGVFGYTTPMESYYHAIVNWMERRHNWKIKKDWITITPGIVPVINFVIHAFTNEGDHVLIQRPVYHPFSKAIVNNNRKLVNSPLQLKNNRYEIDFEDFEKKIIDYDVKVFILCHPHNPVGRVWTKEELIKIGNICLKHHVLILVDEIHHDLIFKNNQHIPFASINELFSNQCITCTAPSKTFNLAGLKVSNIIIENEEIRNQFRRFIESIAITGINTFGIIGCEAAYNTGEEWLDTVLDYIEENKKYVQNFIKNNLPMLHVIDSEGTYLLWIDFRDLGMNHEELETFISNEAKLWLNDGSIFGDEGIGFQRVNIACHRSTLEQALHQLEQAIKERGF